MSININRFLEQKFEQYQTKEIIRTIDLYNDVSNIHVKYLFAILHHEFNKLFRFMFGKTNHHFNAEQSRELLEYIKLYEDMQYVLKDSDLAFEIDSSYQELINECKQFLNHSGGSPIPRDLEKIKIIEYESIFNFIKTVNVRMNGEEKRYPIKLIGEGSYAHVFKYKDEFYDKTFVIKRAKKDLTPKELERFKKEYLIMKELKSPYILEVYRYDENNNEYYAEYADFTLFDYITKNNSTITFDQRKIIAYQIFKAFSYIHSKGYLHRDISLTNILLKFYDNTIVVKVSDFGLVKEKESNLTSTDSDVKGSLNDDYLSVIGFKNYSIKYETYALTKLIMFLMTGKINMEKIDNPKMKNFYLKGINRDVNERYKNIEEMKRYFIQSFE